MCKPTTTITTTLPSNSSTTKNSNNTTNNNCLKDADVVCGRGGLANKHPGNRLFRRIVSENKQYYQKSMNASHKQLLVISIVMAIQKHGGRFMKKEKKKNNCGGAGGGTSGWIEIPNNEANSKTAQALRELDNNTSITTGGTLAVTPSTTRRGRGRAKSSSSNHQQVNSTGDEEDTMAFFTTVTPSPSQKDDELEEDLQLLGPITTNTAKIVDIDDDDCLEDFLFDLIGDGGMEEDNNNNNRHHIEYDDDDLIPLDANNEFELFENNTEYQELCHGLLVQA